MGKWCKNVGGSFEDILNRWGKVCRRVTDIDGVVRIRPEHREDRIKRRITTNLFKYAVGDGVLQEPGYPVGDTADTREYKYFEVSVKEGDATKILIGDGAGVIDGCQVGDNKFDNSMFFQFDMDEYLNVGEDKVYGIFATPYKITADQTDDAEDIGDDRPGCIGYEIIDVTGESPITRRESKMIIASITIAAQTAALTNDMIDNSVQKYLVQRDSLIDDMKDYVDTEIAKAKSELYTFILGDFTQTIQDEIANSDAIVSAYLEDKIAEIEALIADSESTIVEIQTALSELNDFVIMHVALLETKTEDLEAAVDELNEAATQTADFIDLITAQVASNADGVIANEAAIALNMEDIADHEARITAIEDGNDGTIGTWEQINAINTAKNTFRISIMEEKSKGLVENGMYELFIRELAGIDEENSSGYDFDNAGIVARVRADLPDCVAAFKLDENSGSGQVDLLDISGNFPGNPGDDGNYYNPYIFGDFDWVTGKFGSAVKFNKAQVNLQEINTGLTQTIEFQFKIDPTTVPGNYQVLINGEDDNGNRIIMYTVPGEPNEIYFIYRLMGTGISGYITNGASYLDNEFHHVAFVRDGAIMKLYMDGVEVSSGDTTGTEAETADANWGNIQVGMYYNAAYWLKGVIDEFIIWNTALSAQEVATRATTELSVPASDSAVVQLVEYTADEAPAAAMVVADASDDVTYEVSRDGGTTFTAATNGVQVDISGQPSGTAMILKITVPAASRVDNVALLWS